MGMTAGAGGTVVVVGGVGCCGDAAAVDDPPTTEGEVEPGDGVVIRPLGTGARREALRSSFWRLIHHPVESNAAAANTSTKAMTCLVRATRDELARTRRNDQRTTQQQQAEADAEEVSGLAPEGDAVTARGTLNGVLVGRRHDDRGGRRRNNNRSASRWNDDHDDRRGAGRGGAGRRGLGADTVGGRVARGDRGLVAFDVAADVHRRRGLGADTVGGRVARGDRGLVAFDVAADVHRRRGLGADTVGGRVARGDRGLVAFDVAADVHRRRGAVDRDVLVNIRTAGGRQEMHDMGAGRHTREGVAVGVARAVRDGSELNGR
jgi:hypothetical protein